MSANVCTGIPIGQSGPSALGQTRSSVWPPARIAKIQPHLAALSGTESLPPIGGGGVLVPAKREAGMGA